MLFCDFIARYWFVYTSEITHIATAIFNQCPSMIQSLYGSANMLALCLVAWVTVCLSFFVFNLPYVILFFTQPNWADHYLIQPKLFKKTTHRQWFQILRVMLRNIGIVFILVSIFVPSGVLKGLRNPITPTVELVSNPIRYKQLIEVMPNSWMELIIDLLIAQFVEDTAYYWTHRWLHHPSVYGYIHKIHHEIKAPISISSIYAHPIESIQTASTTHVGALFGCSSFFSQCVFMSWRLYVTTEVHCGYKFPWFVDQLLKRYAPFLDWWYAGSCHHDKHHEVFNANFGSTIYFWDWLMATDASSWKRARMQKKAN